MGNKAVLYRMATDEHLCPFGLRSKDLLKRQGFAIDDKKLTTRDQADDFKREHNVDTTPQTFIESRRIGGYQELRKYFGKDPIDNVGTSYKPVIAIFATALLAALAWQWGSAGNVISVRTLMLFIAVSMLILAIQKLQDLYSFTNSFITYDLLAQRHLRYGYAYPFLEAYAGLGMIASLSPLLVSPISIFIGSIGAVSVFKAVYVDKRDLKCACVGGGSNVPLGFVSLTENLFMIAGGLIMLN
ncbi:glutaredoxin family protein [Gilvimarinus agarilyticus]|uniref:MauE/DoxX family redox-associated membrane protein n=1 Tax=Gilvimarinus sp. 2_MG-2023 TaxID=3062666 RepID=UPI001C08920B|nr:MauE/DoxX family redox-associated membrane protein [Gilvimarinus sp. 2_MG-2023]MBU2884374.1 glutaredoxin family protein [Gilvimarinus agarilyticus]MDO6569510.1 glutaredoxin family protein [Gilvimarinus sp. 2_MG-2023]